jgi:hypothetical protein
MSGHPQPSSCAFASAPTSSPEATAEYAANPQATSGHIARRFRGSPSKARLGRPRRATPTRLANALVDALEPRRKAQDVCRRAARRLCSACRIWRAPYRVETALPPTDSLCYHPSIYLDFLCAPGNCRDGVQRLILGAMFGGKARMGRAASREAARRRVCSPSHASALGMGRHGAAEKKWSLTLS